MENILATQAFTNSEIISEPQTGIEPSCKSDQLPICKSLDIYLKSLYFPKLILSACTLVFLTADNCHQWWLRRRLIPIKILNILYYFA